VTGDDVTTRTDVYQLGVLAYELLAGTRPFDLSGKGLAEIERIVLTEEPPAPSEQAEANAGRLRGDLDTILQKALRKEPERRYRSVEALAADLARHRAGEPIAARPATIGYRAKKFVQRNRWGVGVAAAFLALIAVAGTLLVRQRNRAQRNAERARQEAETAEQVSDFLVNLFQSSNPLETLGDTVTARELLRLGTDQVATLDEQPEVKAQMLVSMGRAYEGLGRYQNADSLLSAALSIRQQVSDDQPAKIAEGLHSLGSVAYEQRELQRADSLLKRALTLRRRAYDAPHPALAHTLNDLGIVRRNREQHASADTLYQQALAMRRSLHGPESPEVLSTLDNVAVLRGEQRQYEEAEALYRKVLRLSREAFGNEHPRVANTLHNLAGTLRRQGQLEEAERTYRKALATYRALVGDTHPKVAQSMDDLAGVLRQRGQFAEAASLLRQALVIRRKRFGEDHIKVGTSLNNLAAVLNRQDRYDEAVQMQRRAVSLYERQLGPEHEYVAIALDNLADYLRDRDGCGAAVDEYRRARRILQTEGMDGGLMFADVEGAYGRCLAKIGRYEKAIPLLKRSYQAYEDDDSPRAAEFRRALASAYANWGKPKQARQYRRAADGDASGE
jgi:serine/threonine-protein kinase